MLKDEKMAKALGNEIDSIGCGYCGKVIDGDGLKAVFTDGSGSLYCSRQCKEEDWEVNQERKRLTSHLVGHIVESRY